jgi:hypothetical protein
MENHANPRTILFLQEEYGYRSHLVGTTATIAEIKQWWAEGGFHPCSGKDSGHFTRDLPGEEIFRRAILWKEELNPEPGWRPVAWPQPGDVFHFVDRVERGVRYINPEELVYQPSFVFIHFHMGEDDVLCIDGEEIPHPHANEWSSAIFGEE